MRLNKRNYFHVCESFSCFEKKMQLGMKPNHIFINGARWVFSYFAILKMKLFSEHLTASIHLLVDFWTPIFSADLNQHGVVARFHLFIFS